MSVSLDPSGRFVMADILTCYCKNTSRTDNVYTTHLTYQQTMTIPPEWNVAI